MSPAEVQSVVAQVERVLTRHLLGAPKPPVPRTVYVRTTKSARRVKGLSSRALDLCRYLDKHPRQTSRELQHALRVNRNVIAGAVYQLRRAGLVESETA